MTDSTSYSPGYAFLTLCNPFVTRALFLLTMVNQSIAAQEAVNISPSSGGVMIERLNIIQKAHENSKYIAAIKHKWIDIAYDQKSSTQKLDIYLPTKVKAHFQSSFQFMVVHSRLATRLIFS